MRKFLSIGVLIVSLSGCVGENPTNNNDLGNLGNKQLTTMRSNTTNATTENVNNMGNISSNVGVESNGAVGGIFDFFWDFAKDVGFDWIINKIPSLDPKDEKLEEIIDQLNQISEKLDSISDQIADLEGEFANYIDTYNDDMKDFASNNLITLEYNINQINNLYMNLIGVNNIVTYYSNLSKKQQGEIADQLYSPAHLDELATDSDKLSDNDGDNFTHLVSIINRSIKIPTKDHKFSLAKYLENYNNALASIGLNASIALQTSYDLELQTATLYCAFPNKFVRVLSEKLNLPREDRYNIDKITAVLNIIFDGRIKNVVKVVGANKLNINDYFQAKFFKTPSTRAKIIDFDGDMVTYQYQKVNGDDSSWTTPISFQASDCDEGGLDNPNGVISCVTNKVPSDMKNHVIDYPYGISTIALDHLGYISSDGDIRGDILYPNHGQWIMQYIMQTPDGFKFALYVDRTSVTKFAIACLPGYECDSYAGDNDVMLTFYMANRTALYFVFIVADNPNYVEVDIRSRFGG
jgi:hypothetical protein